MSAIILTAIVLGLVCVVVVFMFLGAREDNSDFNQIKRREKAMEVVRKWYEEDQ